MRGMRSAGWCCSRSKFSPTYAQYSRSVQMGFTPCSWMTLERVIEQCTMRRECSMTSCVASWLATAATVMFFCTASILAVRLSMLEVASVMIRSGTSAVSPLAPSLQSAKRRDPDVAV